MYFISKLHLFDFVVDLLYSLLCNKSTTSRRGFVVGSTSNPQQIEAMEFEFRLIVDMFTTNDKTTLCSKKNYYVFDDKLN